jgi:uncharacterized protein (TIGR02001 family)
MKNRGLASVAALLAAGAAQAGSYSITPTIATDYDFRGVSQTDPLDQNGKPAFQVGGTYTFDNGLYLGAWGSNVDDSFGDLDGHDIEIDYYGGYAWGDAATSFAYDAGLNFYTYPGLSDANTVEAYIGVTRSFFSAKLWYSPNVASSSNSGFYAELNANFPLANLDGLSLVAHVGQAFGQAYNEPVDYSIGTSYAFNNVKFGVKYVDGTKSIQGRLIASISATLPWSAE